MTIIDTRLTHNGDLRFAYHNDGGGVTVINTRSGEQFTAPPPYTMGRVVAAAEHLDGDLLDVAYSELKQMFED